MRKSRGKRKDNGEWVKGSLCRLAGLYFIAEYPVGAGFNKETHIKTISGWYEVIKSTVGQNIGLLDKNDKEIYEDDIIKLEHYGIVKVRWLRGEFYLWAIDDMESLSITMGEQGEIIGNIHDTDPETQ